MKVLLIATVQSHICQFHKPLVEMLRKHGNVEIHVAAKNNLAEKNGMKLDFADTVFDVPFDRSPFSLKNLTAYRMLKKIVRDGHYDVIHCNTPVGGILGRMVGSRERKHGTKVIYTAHGFHFYHGAPKKNWMIYYPIEKCFSRKTDVLVTINYEDYELAKRKFKCRTEHIHGVGVDAVRYRPGTPEEIKCLKSQLGLTGKNILCVGELLPNKNQAMIIRAMVGVVKTIPDAHLLLAGNGPEKERLTAQIHALGLTEHITLLGYCTNLELYQRACDVSVSCSKREGLGLNLIEAMLSGNPVIGTRNRGHNELIQDDTNGRLIDIEDDAMLEKTIIQVLTNPDMADRYTENGLQSVAAYTSDQVKQELSYLYYSDIDIGAKI